MATFGTGLTGHVTHHHARRPQLLCDARDCPGHAADAELVRTLDGDHLCADCREQFVAQGDLCAECNGWRRAWQGDRCGPAVLGRCECSEVD